MISMNALIAEYTAWNKAQGLQLGSADEHLADESLTPDQRAWLVDYTLRWDTTQNRMDKAREGLVLDIPADAWEPTGEADERNRLLTTIRINGAPMHLQAIEVRENDKGELEAVCDVYADDLDRLYLLTGAAMMTQTIDGREYILHAAPFSP